jgi:hypothetical protein
VTVTQSGATPMLAVAPLNRTVSPMPGTTDFSVSSNTDWTATSDSAWCVVTPGGSGNGTIVANYAENPYYIQRVATITVVASGAPVQQVTVSQLQSTVSVSDQQAEGIRIYPNPTAGKFRITAHGPGAVQLEVKVMYFTGKIVSSKSCTAGNDCNFDLTTLPEGCYFIRIKSGNDYLTRKLIIIR